MQPNGRASGYVVARPRKRDDVWFARIRTADGERFSKTLGKVWTKHTTPPAGYLTKSQAEGVLRGILVDADHGKLAMQQAVGVTFKDACEAWLRYVEHDRKRRPSTVSDYKSSVWTVLVPFFTEDRAINTVSAHDVDAFRAARIKDGRSAATINKQLRILHSIFKYAVRCYGLHANPVAGVDRQPQNVSGDFNFLTPAEIQALGRAAKTEQESALYVVAGFTGLRMGELRALEWQDVDFSKRLIHIRRNYTKGNYGLPKSGKVRSVPMADHVLAALDRLSRREWYVDPDCLVFCNEVGGILSYDQISKPFKRALTRAGLKPVRFHDLRHSFGTMAVQAFPLSDVRGYMGHADIQTTMRYVHHVPQHDAADKLSKLITGDSEMVPETVPNTPK